jgi:hypothetical protein
MALWERGRIVEKDGAFVVISVSLHEQRFGTAKDEGGSK